uniref:Uncharacterized protein n=1 Tax=Rhipicephalus microplus TaxID=6941 RepID=A0A6M2DBU4_RHIMP
MKIILAFAYSCIHLFIGTSIIWAKVPFNYLSFFNTTINVYMYPTTALVIRVNVAHVYKAQVLRQNLTGAVFYESCQNVKYLSHANEDEPTEKNVPNVCSSRIIILVTESRLYHYEPV